MTFISSDRPELIEEIEQLKAERDSLREQLELKGVHTCSEQCHRPVCVMRRERDRYRQALASLLSGISIKEETAPEYTDTHLAYVDKEDLIEAQQALAPAAKGQEK